MTGDTALGEGREFDLVRAMLAHWGPLAAGIGDDAALLRPPRGEQLVVSTDAALELTHFRREWLTMREIAARAVTAALSDLAAMAASPLAVLVSLQWPESGSRADLLDFADGVADAVRAAGSATRIVGGNVARAELLGVTTTVVGSVFTPLTRSAARPGDLLYVTGQLGGAAVALRALEARATLGPELRARFARPRARLDEARWLAARGAVAAIDLSDGLSSDAGHLAAASGVAIELDVERLPLFPGATAEDAASGGDEYELLLAARAPLPVDEFAATFGLPLTLIGRAVSGEQERKVRFLQDGARVEMPAGYDHLSR